MLRKSMIMMAGVLLSGALLTGGAQAAVWYVNGSSHATTEVGTSWTFPFKTVQSAIDAAAAGDMVWVVRGTYLENLSMKNGVSVLGGFLGGEANQFQRNPAANVTTIDGGDLDSVVHFIDCPDPPTGISGFTLTHGNAGMHIAPYYYGGGIYAWQSAPYISNNRIVGNRAQGFGYGGGIYLGRSVSGTQVVGNVIENNVSDGEGGGMMISGDLYGGDLASILIARNVIRGNSAVPNGARGNGGGMLVVENSPRIVSNLFDHNSATLGGGIYVSRGAYPALWNNTFADNTVTQVGGGVYYYAFEQWRYPQAPLPGGDLANNIFAFNTSGIQRDETLGGVVNLYSNDVFGNPGGDYLGLLAGAADISADPLFANAGSGNYRLRHSPLSPCIDAGDNNFAYSYTEDLDGRRRPIDLQVDMGAYESGSIPPYTTCAVSGTLGLNGWYVNPSPIVTLTTSEIVASTKWAISGTATFWVPYTAPFSYGYGGDRSIFYYSADPDGNIEAIRSTPIKYDGTLPWVNITAPLATITYTRTPSATMAGTSVDSHSGLLSVRWKSAQAGSGLCTGTSSWTAAIPLAAGLNTVNIVAMDKAGNSSGGAPFKQFILDNTLPSVSISSPVGTTTTSVTPFPFTGTASDAESGLLSVRWMNAGAGSGSCTGTSSWSAGVPLVVGVNTVIITARDRAGNIRSASKVVFYSLPDTTPPALTITFPVSGGGTYATTLNSVPFGGNVSDSGSGVSSVLWANAAGGSGSASVAGTRWSATATGLSAGANLITVSARDVAGNTATQSFTINFTPDTTPPALTITFPVSRGTYLTNLTSVPMFGTVYDSVSGVSSVLWANAAGGSGSASVAGTRWSATATGLSAGANPITITARDAAGNAATRGFIIYFDITPPTVPAVPTGGKYTAAIVITFSEPIAQGTAFTGITVKTTSGKITDVTKTRACSGSQVTLTASMTAGKSYKVTLPASCVRDLAGNGFAGLTFNYAATK